MSAKIKVIVPKEHAKNETRVSASPDSVKLLIKNGFDVVVEHNAGERSSFSDQEYEKAGAKIEKNHESLYGHGDIVIAVNPPTKEQLQHIKEKSVWISFFLPQNEAETIKKLSDKKITCFSMNLIPRITRAQTMDALSSQSSIAGYKAVIMAANELSKIFPLTMTPAGTLHPAKVIILGAGVAGLQAIATAKRLGAVVEASDVRPAVKEQVESLGAKFIDVPFEQAEDKSGYAKEVSQEYLKKQNEEIKKRLPNADIVITTAMIPGKKAPILLTKDMVALMKNGSVIVDLAAEQGGNCELTKADEIVEHDGIKIIGTANIPATVATHSTEMYAKNIAAFVSGLIKDGKLFINLEDQIYKDSLVTHEGKVMVK